MSERKRSGRQTARWVECSDAIAGSLSALGCSCLRVPAVCLALRSWLRVRAGLG